MFPLKEHKTALRAVLKGQHGSSWAWILFGSIEHQWAGLPGEPWTDMQAVNVLTDEVFEVSGPVQSQESHVCQAGPGFLEGDVKTRRLPLFF